MRKSDIETIRNSTLFRNVSDEVFRKISVYLNGVPEDIPAGQLIYSPGNYRKCIAIILKGTAIVNNQTGMLLSILTKGGIFGIPVLYSVKPFPTQVAAKEACRVFYIQTEEFTQMLKISPELTEEFISILSDRVMFLTERIDRITAPSPEEKLRSFLESIAMRQNSEKFTLPLPLSGIASTLSMGRTTLYRAFDILIAQGAIKKDGKEITLLNNRDLIP